MPNPSEAAALGSTRKKATGHWTDDLMGPTPTLKILAALAILGYSSWVFPPQFHPLRQPGSHGQHQHKTALDKPSEGQFHLFLAIM
jgi:hypothetical protein